MKLFHVINPVKVVSSSSDLGTAQPITLASLELATQLATEAGITVNHLAVGYPEDNVANVNNYPFATLSRSVLDVNEFNIERKLPILSDILDSAYGMSDDDTYIIYTNIDIAVQPTFYIAIAQLIKKGYESFCINRRDNIKLMDSLALMQAQGGNPHPGLDCFIFPCSKYPNYIMKDVCIGIPKCDRALALNMANNGKFNVFTDLHLTFHIGCDQEWGTGKYDDYIRFNNEQYQAVLDHYDITRAQVITLGRCGSKYLMSKLQQAGIQLEGNNLNHLYPDEVIKRAIPKVIFLYTDPIEIVLSLWEQEKVKGRGWIQQHFANMNADFSMWEHIAEYDSLQMERMIDAYLNKNLPFDVLFLRYDNLFKHQESISKFLGKDINLDDFRPRARRFNQLKDDELKQKLTKTYHHLQDKVNNLPECKAILRV